ncbi:MAG: PTS transporter subunit EIIA [Deltaproteobacteria bacterium]|nr:PTS transporter subunit EIIA [Deltaproteobacteria bacterium]
MKILDFLTPATILTRMAATDKAGAIEELSISVADFTGIDNKEIIRVLLERERLGSTGIGGGIAIPHGKLAGLDRLVMGFGRSENGVEFDSLDGKSIFIFLVLLSPDNSTGLHLRLLARLSKLLKDTTLKDSLMRADLPEDVLRLIGEVDEEI